MVVIQSERAKKLLRSPEALIDAPTAKMKSYQSSGLNLWALLETEGTNVKKLSYSGKLPEHQIVLIEALNQLIKNKNLSVLSHLSLRECEAYLRDRNSQVAIEGLETSDEEKFKKFLTWLQLFPLEKPAQEYQYTNTRGPFSSLKLVDKVKELKAFLNSPEILALYQDIPRPELVDVDELTVYVQVPYQSEKERALFEELHQLGVGTFQEENLNFIPEA